MPAPETMFRRDWVIVWPATGRDQYNRWVRSSEYLEYKVRWVAKRRVVTTDAQGKPVYSDVTLSSPVELPLGTPVWRGRYEDLEAAIVGTDITDLVPTSDIYEVIGNDTSSDHRGQTNGYLVHLRRLGDTMPDAG